MKQTRDIDMNDKRNRTLSDGSNYGMGMKYYNYLKVALILGAILNLGQSITYFNGEVYLKEGLKAAFVYSKFPDMKVLDIAYGIVIIVFSAFQLYVRHQLMWQTRRAPKLIVILHAVSLVPNMIYNIGAGFIIGDVFSAISSSVIPVSIISPIYAYITYVYFSKRKFIFVN